MTRIATDQEIAELRAGLDGTTDVHWYPGHLCRDDHSCDCRYIFAENDRMGSIASVVFNDGREFGEEYPPRGEAKRNQAHIARCSPEFIRALLARLDAAEALNREAAEVMRPFSEIGEAMGILSDLSSAAACSVTGKVPRKDEWFEFGPLNLGQFRRARAFLQKIEAKDASRHD